MERRTDDDELAPARKRRGRQPTNLRAAVTYREGPDGKRRKVDVIDMVGEVMMAGGSQVDAAAAVGVAGPVLSRWRSDGVRARADLLAGVARYSELSAHAKACAELADVIETAEAACRRGMLAIVRAAAVGELPEEVTTTETLDAEGKATTSTKRSTRGPDPAAARWYLERRYPADYGTRRVEHTGPDGGPVRVEAQSVLDRIRDRINEVRTTQEGNADSELDKATGAGEIRTNETPDDSQPG